MNKSNSAKAPRSGWTWSLGGSLFASLCCLGPVVAVLFGLTGVSFLFGLTRYRLPLLVTGLGFAGLGLVMTLRQSRRVCNLEQHRRNLWLFPTVTLATFAVTYGVLTYIVPTAVYNSLEPSPAAASSVQKGDRTVQPEALPQGEVQAPANPEPALSVPAGREDRTGQPEAPSSAEAQPPANPAPAAGPRRATLAISGMT